MKLPIFPKTTRYKKEADWTHHVQNVVCLEKIDGTNTRIGIPKTAESSSDIVIGGRTLLESDQNFHYCKYQRKQKFLLFLVYIKGNQIFFILKNY